MTDGIPASRSMNGLENSFILFGAYSDRYMAVSREMGTAMTMAMPVTHRVPMMKGSIPKSPLRGGHELENRISPRDLSLRMGHAFTHRPSAMRNTRNPDPRVIRSIVLLAILSLMIRPRVIERPLQAAEEFHRIFFDNSSVCFLIRSGGRQIYPASGTYF